MDFDEYVSQGTAFFQEKKFDSAIESFELALKIQPENTVVQQTIGYLKEMVRLASEEAQSLEREAKARAKVMRALFGITDAGKAIREGSEALRRNPNDASAKELLSLAYYIRGLMFESKGELSLAIEGYSEAIKNNPDYRFAFKRRGSASLDIGNYEQAIKDFERLIQFDPNDARAKEFLASVYSQRGTEYDHADDYARAIPDFEKVLQFNPDDSTVRKLLEVAKAELAKNSA